MQSLQRTIQTIIEQMKTLPPTAKMLVGSLMVILVMSLFLVSLYAGQPALVPLGLKSTLTPDARAKAISYLEMRNIKYSEEGGDLLVPAEQKYTILAQLTENQLIDADQINFDRLMTDESLIRTRDQNRQRYLVAKMNVLSNMISQMNGIERATVVIDQPEGISAIGKSHVPPSASVSVTTRGGELNQTLVDAIAQLVSRSHAGLKPENVAIVDARTGRAMQARTNDHLTASRYFDVKLAAEKHAKSTLESVLGFIPGVRIAVNAQVDTKEVVQHMSKFGDPKLGLTGESTRSITSTNMAVGAEPGVMPNTGASLSGMGRGGSQLADERTETTAIPVVDRTNSQLRDARGYALKINATIGVPRSYFVRLHQERTGDAEAQPDPAALDQLVEAESERLREFITPLIDTDAVEGAIAGVVRVEMFPDFGVVLTSGSQLVPGGAGSPGGIGGITAGGVNDSLVKYVTLGGLAALSLVMMFLMVRKANVREELPTAAELVGMPPALAAADSDLVGEADEAAPALEGVELNDDAIRRQQMLDQIKEMVTTAPEEAAMLLRRWIKSEV